jgi:hypothetical protein
MSSPSWLYVLIEDQRQKQFIYRFLAMAGLSSRQMTIEVSPAGKGSAEQWVRENFARQAGKCRARNARAATGMIVMLDADMRTVRERLDALDDALECAEQQPIDENRDPIARLIPKRNVETWILCLSTRGTLAPPVDEERDYKLTKTSEEWSEAIPPAAGTLFAWTRPSSVLPENLIDSLRQGLREISRAIPANQ